jgi:hypothetical protein
MMLSKTKDITAHNIYSIYNKLFSHLDAAEAKLKNDLTPLFLIELEIKILMISTILIIEWLELLGTVDPSAGACIDSNPRCSDTMEFNISDAQPCQEAPAIL